MNQYSPWSWKQTQIGTIEIRDAKGNVMARIEDDERIHAGHQECAQLIVGAVNSELARLERQQRLDELAVKN